jgi:hypothetical protein
LAEAIAFLFWEIPELPPTSVLGKDAGTVSLVRKFHGIEVSADVTAASGFARSRRVLLSLLGQ